MKRINSKKQTKTEEKGKEIIILRDYLLIKKPCGVYKCPQYLNPTIAGEILQSNQVEAGKEATKFLAEIMENFGIEIAKHFKGKKITSRSLSKIVKEIKFQ